VPVQAGDEDAGVDGASDGGVDGDGRDDGQAEHVRHVALRERSPGLDDDNHAVVAHACREQGAQADVARASEDGVVLHRPVRGAEAPLARLDVVERADLGAAPVDHDRGGAPWRNVAVGVGSQGEIGAHVDPLVAER
jgi:hypothetical protein